MWISGKEEKMEDISHYFMFFPQFRKDFQALFNEGVIRRITLYYIEYET
jgi:hypothetical protein